MQQELIEMLEETISYVEVWHKEDQDVLDKAEALVEKAKNNNVPAGPQGEQINKALGKLRAAQWCHPNEVERLIDEAIDALVAATPAPAQEQCNACCGTGRMVRDPDIGTDQECFVCDGTGFLPAQEPVTLTPAEIDRAVLEATGFDGFGTQPMNTHDTRNIGLEVIAALRAKENKL